MPVEPIPYPASTDDVSSMPPSSASAATSSEDIVERIALSAHRTIDRLAESAGPHVRALQDSWSGGDPAMHSRADQVRQMGDEWTETVRSTVREHPLAAIGVALAVGMLLARTSR